MLTSNDFHIGPGTGLLGQTLPRVLAAAASDEADSVAFLEGEQAWTWTRWQESAQALARGLQERGVSRGDVVVAQLPNCWAFLVVHAAVAAAGGVLLPVNPREPGRSLMTLAQRVQAQSVITMAEGVGASDGDLVPIVGAPVSGPDGVVLLPGDRPAAISDLIEEFAGTRPRNVRVRPDDPFLLTSSSGTTSRRPKICMHSHDGLLSNAAAVVTASRHSKADRLVSAAPLTHLFGLLSVHMALFSHSSQLMLDGWRPEKLIDVMRSSAGEQVTLFAVPTQLRDLSAHLRREPHARTIRFREVRTAGSAVPATLVADLRESCAESVVVQWGMSELGAGLFTSTDDPDSVASRSIGRPVAGARVRIVDENGADCPTGTVGELLFASPNHFRGYLRDPELTKRSFEDGWLRTGDLASLDESGLVAFHGRAAEMIDVGGRKFPATEVEELLEELSGVGPAAVVGRADERLGEYPSLLVTESCSATLADITKHLTAKGTAPHKLPAELLIVPDIPRTATGKIIRHRLAEMANQAERVHRREEPDEACGPRAEELVHVVIAQAQAVLASGPEEEGELDPAQAFRDMGIDSLGAMRLAKALSTVIGRDVSSADIFNHATPAALAAHLAGRPSGSDRAAPVLTRRCSAADDDPVVIVGMACRLPGAVDTPEDFWRLLLEEREVVGPPPSDRGWSVPDLLANGVPGVPPDLAGGFLDDVAGFDAELFGISPVEARAMDPQHRLLLELTWEALSRAGLDPLALQGPGTGVFVGTMASDYLPRVSESLDRYNGYAITGNAGGAASGRISYHLGLRGPSVTVDTACSSSLVALHQARRALRDGECDRAVVAGVTVMSTPATFVDFGRQGLLAPDGRCKAFAAGADGVAWSEGAGVVVLERLSAARRRGHPVVAAIVGSAINSDGASNGLTAPNGIAQQEVIQQALADAGLTAADVQAVEAHGTGTRLGDLIEGRALQAVYGHDRTAGLWVGSAKSNLGHTQAAAGIVGLIKMALSVQHGMLSRTLHVDTPLDQVDWSPGGLRLLTETTAWTGDSPRRGGVSAFGIGGTNAHVVLEQPPGDAADDEPPPAPTYAEPAPWVLSAASADALRATAARLRDLAGDLAATAPEQIRGRLDDVARTLAHTRSSLPHRAIALPDDAGDHRPALAALATGDHSDDAAEGRGRGNNDLTAFVFSGQGQQWWGMARELARTAPPFATALAKCDQALLPHLGWSVADLLLTDGPEPAMPVDVVQPALFAMMVALAALWRAHGVRPDAVTGHSQGEIVAAYVAGALSLDDAARIVVVRGRLLRKLAGNSGMAVVERPVGEVGEILESLGNPVSIGTVNGPRATGISGEISALEATMAGFRERGIPVHRIAVDYASHSPLMDPLLEDLRAELADVRPRRSEIPFFSTTTGGQVDGLELTADHWCRNLRETVYLRQAVATMAERSYRRFIEVSVHPVLSDSIEETLAETGTKGAVIATVRRDAADLRAFRRSLGQAFVHRVGIDWDALLGSATGRFAEVPRYPFQHQRFWHDAPTVARSAGSLPPAAEEPVAQKPAERDELGFDTLLALVREQAAQVAGYSGADSIPGDRTFDELGFTSLSYTELQARIVKRTGLRPPTHVIRVHATPEALSRLLAVQTGVSESSAAKRPTFAAVHGADVTTVHAADLTLDKFLDAATLAGAAALPRATGAPATVLLTGANGYLGRFLCLEWLQRLSRTGGRLICLVRGETVEAATARLSGSFAGDDNLSVRFRELAADHLEVVRGDVAEPNLGLDTATWRLLSETVDLIVHAAAQVNHVLPYDELFGANVVGTTELIRMALTTRIKPINYVSTAAVVAAQTPCPDEDSDIRVSSPVRELKYDYANGYATSKWAGEVVLREAHDLCGLPVTVFRPGMILAHSRYAAQLNVSDVFTRLLLSLIATGLAPKSFYSADPTGDRRSAHYDGLPVDFTAEAITELGARAGDGYRTFNVINPHDDGISLDTFVDWLVEAGCSLDRVDDHTEWHTRFEAAVRGLPEPLRRNSVLPLLHAFAAPMDLTFGTHVPADGFRATVRGVDSGLGRDIPHVSAALITKYALDLSRLGLTAHPAEHLDAELVRQ